MDSLISLRLLADLHDLDLAGEIHDEGLSLKEHDSELFCGRSRRHGGMQVAIKRLRVNVLENQKTAKVLVVLASSSSCSSSG